MRKLLIVSILVLIVLTGCDVIAPSPTATPTSTPTYTPTATFTSTSTSTPTITPTPTSTPTSTHTPTPSDTPTPTETSTPTVTDTLEPATITSNGHVNCRYGPNTAYMIAWELHDGDLAMLDGRNYNKTWLYVKPHDTDWHCWVAASAVTPSVDVSLIAKVSTSLYIHPEVPSLKGLSASRNGNKVTITWYAAPPSVGLGYLIEASVCSGGYIVDAIYTTTNTATTLTDDSGCSRSGRGQVRVFNKLGYSSPVSIPWP